MDPKLQKLQNILTLVTESITRKEFVDAFDAVVAYVKEIKQTNVTEFSAIHQALKTLTQQVKEDATSDVDELKAQVAQAVEKALKDQSTSLNVLRDSVTRMIQGKQGDKGEPGQDADEQAVITAVLAQIPPDVEETAEETRDKLESLKGDARLDASAIKNLPELIQQQPHVIGGHGPLWQLQDVDVSGITIGQSIKWDGIRWIPYTPVGGNTAVYNEVVSGSANTFTLAHTPVTGTLRVYANGQRLLPTTDYTLSGAIITTISAWDAGTVSSDYEY